MDRNDFKKIFKKNISMLDKQEFKIILNDLKELNKICDKYDSSIKNKVDNIKQHFLFGIALANKYVDDIFDKYPYPEKSINDEINIKMEKIKYYAKTDELERLWNLLKIL